MPASSGSPLEPLDDELELLLAPPLAPDEELAAPSPLDPDEPWSIPPDELSSVPGSVPNSELAAGPNSSVPLAPLQATTARRIEEGRSERRFIEGT